ncbi:hypothetical protein [Bacillus cereus group sp. TH253LC]|uniref:hypothetical protein n=1 Tax=Bacillus cereus group sp. TH253LC TaxID=3018043 RepID=UPI0022E2D284|nr:hypothetical protein [Bacillus cereus group sp. TH253LC]MDA1545814.1 hypothetical protein [Bacillus cereus group sp. TH253LC]
MSKPRIRDVYDMKKERDNLWIIRLKCGKELQIKSVPTDYGYSSKIVISEKEAV